MKVVVQGQGPVSLSQDDYVASGGEGSIYCKGLTAYKIYAEPTRMIPVGKITELTAITDANVIRPQHVLLDPKGTAPIGYTMRFVPDTMPLCQTFTRAFREREGLGHDKALALVRNLQERIVNIHKAGILVVDLNEMNFLVSKALDDIFAIDVDSYQTRSYPATAIMPSIKDWSVKGHAFTEGSDWFSFACVAMQMFLGIHPYKGKHPSVSGFEERMKASISIFDPAVTYPKVVYPFDVIPSVYRAWFKAVLQDGKRLAPPTELVAAVVVTHAVQQTLGDAALDIVELFDFPAAVQGYAERAGVSVTGTLQGLFLGKHRVYGATGTMYGTIDTRAVGFSPKGNVPVAASVVAGNLVLFNLSLRALVPLDIRADAIMGYGGRIYVQSNTSLVEVILSDTAGGVVASPKVVANILPHATKLYEGVAVQNLLGSVFVSILPRSGAHYQVRAPELDTYRVVDARCDGRVLMVIGVKQGKYDRLVFMLDANYDTATLHATVRDITPSGLNFIVFDNGVCVHLNEDEKLEVTAIGNPKVRVVDAPVLSGDMRLVKHGGRVAFIRGNKVYSLRLK